MSGISEILSNDDFSRIVSDLCVDTIEDRDPKEYLEEYNGERRRRKTSVGFREPKKWLYIQIQSLKQTQILAKKNQNVWKIRLCRLLRL